MMGMKISFPSCLSMLAPASHNHHIIPMNNLVPVSNTQDVRNMPRMLALDSPKPRQRYNS